MRVIAGQAKGRRLKAVPGMATRPTSDKIKEAVFNAIGPYFTGGIALDLFAGTGGLGIEALSRGMERAIFVDKQKKSIETVRINLGITDLELQAELYNNDALRALKVLAKREIQFDVIFIDPPYELSIVERILEQIDTGHLYHANTIIVVEQDAKVNLPTGIGRFICQKATKYGNTMIFIYRFHETNET